MLHLTCYQRKYKKPQGLEKLQINFALVDIPPQSFYFVKCGTSAAKKNSEHIRELSRVGVARVSVHPEPTLHFCMKNMHAN